MVDFSASRQHLAFLTLDLGLSLNGCMSWLNDCKFQVCDSIYQDWIVFWLEWSFLARFLVSRRDLLTIVHVSQVSILVFAQFFLHILITDIFFCRSRTVVVVAFEV